MKKKHKILTVATRLFAHKGYMDTSVAEISNLAETAQGTLFYHFKTKEDLFIAVLENVRNELRKDFDDFLAEHSVEDGRTLMKKVIEFYLDLAVTKESLFLLIHRYHSHLMAQENPQCREPLEAIYNSLIEVFEQIIVAGRNEGHFGPVPVRNTALLIFNLIDGLARFRSYHLFETEGLAEDLTEACLCLLKAESGALGAED